MCTGTCTLTRLRRSVRFAKPDLLARCSSYDEKYLCCSADLPGRRRAVLASALSYSLPSACATLALPIADLQAALVTASGQLSETPPTGPASLRRRCDRERSSLLSQSSRGFVRLDWTRRRL